MNDDTSTRFLFRHCDVRGTLVTLDQSFRTALAQFAASILTPELEAALPQLRNYLYQHVSPEERIKLIGVLNRIAHRCWSGELDVITPGLWLAEVQAAEEISENVKGLWEQKLRETLGENEIA